MELSGFDLDVSDFDLELSDFDLELSDFGLELSVFDLGLSLEEECFLALLASFSLPFPGLSFDLLGLDVECFLDVLGLVLSRRLLLSDSFDLEELELWECLSEERLVCLSECLSVEWLEDRSCDRLRERECLPEECLSLELCLELEVCDSLSEEWLRCLRDESDPCLSLSFELEGLSLRCDLPLSSTGLASCWLWMGFRGGSCGECSGRGDTCCCCCRCMAMVSWRYFGVGMVSYTVACSDDSTDSRVS